MRIIAAIPQPDNSTTRVLIPSPADLVAINAPARLYVHAQGAYNPNWTIALGHAVQRGLSIIITTPKEEA